MPIIQNLKYTTLLNNSRSKDNQSQIPQNVTFTSISHIAHQFNNFTSTHVTPMQPSAICMWYQLLSLTVFTFKPCSSLKQITTNKAHPSSFQTHPSGLGQVNNSHGITKHCLLTQMMHVQSQQSYAIKTIPQS